MAAGLLKVPRAACKFVMQGDDLRGVYFGEIEEAWSEAADLSAKINMRYVDRPFHTVLATKISPERCKRINLGYMNPDEINPAKYEGREDEGVLYVPKAGEILYRLKNAADWQKV